METDSLTTNMILNSDQLQSQSPIKQDSYLWPAFVPPNSLTTSLDVRPDLMAQSSSASSASSPKLFPTQISPGDLSSQVAFQTAASNPTFNSSLMAGDLLAGSRPLSVSRSHTSLATGYAQQAIPRTRSFDFGRPSQPQQLQQLQQLQQHVSMNQPLANFARTSWGAPPQEQRGLKRRWSPSLDATQENRLETLWNTHGVEGSGHLGILPPDVNHDAPSTFQSFTGGTTGADMTASMFDLWANPTSTQPNPFVFGQPDGFVAGSTFIGGGGVGVPPLGFPLGPSNGSPDDGIEVDDGIVGDTIMSVNGVGAPKVEDDGRGVDSHFGRASSVDSGTTTGLKKGSGDISPDHDPHDPHDPDDGDPEGDEDLDDHHVKADPEKPNKPANNNFVNKLHTMISDPKSASFIWWTELGTSFIVSSAGEFSREILGQHFKHSNFSSFVRQLNMYGFHKINRTPRNQRPQADAQRWEFSHPKFLRGRTDLLEDIKRKTIEPDPNQARQRVELPTEVAAQLRRMNQEHKEVVDALVVERKKVEKLINVVKTLYDVLGNLTNHSLAPFPMDLLDNLHSPTLGSPQMDDPFVPPTVLGSRPMKLTGNTLVPAGPSSAGSSPTNLTSSPPDRRPARTTRSTAVAVEQQRVDADGHANKRTRLEMEMAVSGTGLVRRTSARGQSQSEGSGLPGSMIALNGKRRAHTTAIHGHPGTTGLRYTSG